MNKLDLAGRVAVVTGGARGIGLAVARRMVASGAAVSIWDLDPAKTEERNYALTEAEKSLARAYQLSERKLAAVHLQLARLHERRGDRARAADELEQYLRQSPDLKNAPAIREAIKTLRTPASDKKTP